MGIAVWRVTIKPKIIHFGGHVGFRPEKNVCLPTHLGACSHPNGLGRPRRSCPARRLVGASQILGHGRPSRRLYSNLCDLVQSGHGCPRCGVACLDARLQSLNAVAIASLKILNQKLYSTIAPACADRSCGTPKPGDSYETGADGAGGWPWGPDR